LVISQTPKLGPQHTPKVCLKNFKLGAACHKNQMISSLCLLSVVEFPADHQQSATRFNKVGTGRYAGSGGSNEYALNSRHPRLIIHNFNGTKIMLLIVDIVEAKSMELPPKEDYV
jgi:hypothetical protein